ncbi:hypothetical protein KJS94_16980 [Flavihumibacter rivuli]|uniref:hypothetical protein n=1 Tax=Flavihumibacter rivuli TaxID=2838156 RepID=UPI001BDDD589|nr:hypothetical protein [Flavihumibacter rivuli]ULQ56346.1 hypothetical protein KJS94_16980 [Flavihumibacter rivuli]
MNQAEQIQQELEMISKLVAQQPRQLPYSVPEGYFDAFPLQMIGHLRQDGNAVASGNSPKAVNDAPFSVPEGYFDNLATNILSRIRTMEAGQEEQLPPALENIGKTNPYQVPDDYFDSLPDTIVEGAKAIEVVNEELENLSPLLQSLKNKPTYQVPDGYFGKLPSQLIDKIKPAGKVISFTNRWLRYAAAAILTGALAISGWWYTNKDNQSGALAEVSATHQVEKEISQLSEEAIQEFIDPQADLLQENTIASSVKLNESDVHYLLEDISDDVLQQYLSEHSAKPSSTIN